MSHPSHAASPRISRRTWLAVGAGEAALFWAPSVGAYELDGVNRRVPQARIVYCPRLPFIQYRGRHVTYEPVARVHPAFVQRLMRFEQVACEVGQAVYGRPPTRLQHIGSLVCRRMRGHPELFSEHAFGNALDVTGFSYPPLEESLLPPGVHPVFGNAFSVTVGRHWRPQPGVAGLHSTFLRRLMRALIARADIFRCVLGPAAQGHSRHFHFDCGRDRRVVVFAEESES